MESGLVTTQDAIIEEEMTGSALPAPSRKNKRNAFMELMSPKPKKSSNDKPVTLAKASSFIGRDGLGAYTNDPAKYPPSRVIYFSNEFVAINDLFPKSSVHTLLLWRSPKNLLHPFDSLEDADFRGRVREEVNKLCSLVGKELCRKFGRFSSKDKCREEVLRGEVDVPEGEDLPLGRNWEKDLMVGVHAHPSMSHFHVHVMSLDRFSECLKHRKHYNSFSTPFFVPLDDFPLANNDPRRHPGRERYLDQDLQCWRCGRNFGKSFSKLKVHLNEEFEEWKKE